MRVTVFETPRSNHMSKGKAGFVDALLKIKQIVVLKRNTSLEKKTIRPEQGMYITPVL